MVEDREQSALLQLANLLRRRRLELRLTQRQMGRDHSWVSQIENAKALPGWDFLDELIGRLTLEAQRKDIQALYNEALIELKSQKPDGRSQFRRSSLDSSSDSAIVIAKTMSEIPNTAKSKGYALNLFETTYKLPAHPGDPIEILEVRELRSLVEGLEAWQSTHTYWEDSPDMNPEISLFGEGIFDIVRETDLTTQLPGKSYTQRVRFAKPLGLDEVLRFTLYKRYRADFSLHTAHGKRAQRDVIPVVAIDHLTINVQFPVGLQPGAIWYFEDVSEYETPGAPGGHELVPNAANVVSRTWTNPGPTIGQAYGIAWRW